ncbi:hypothetical protein STEG23_037936 [Scotinomys teguina]
MALHRLRMEYYAAEKNNDIMKFADKWMELENIILTEVTQTQKDKHDTHKVLPGLAPKTFYFLGKQNPGDDLLNSSTDSSCGHRSFPRVLTQ